MLVAATWGIAILATGGVILRPWRLPEAIWAVAGAALLVLAGLLSPADAWRGVARGTDVYLFLAGMMLLAEVARREGLFDWLAAKAAALARGSARRLFALVYAVGTLVTVFMSNDATAVVLTPAVAAVARAVRAEQPLPFLLICAFIANAASFVLPISNPANLVIYGSHMPPLLEWLPRYAVPSILSILATYVALFLTQRRALRQTLAREVRAPALGTGGRLAACGLGLTAIVLLTASALDWQLGLPTCVAGALTAGGILLLTRSSPAPILRNMSWGVLPLVAGLFVLIEALDRTGLIPMVAGAIRDAVAVSPVLAAWASGVLPAFLCNAMNNLPAGLIAGSAVQTAHPPEAVTGAVLIGIDLGPNLSVTGSLATILWLSVLRREGLHVGAGAFLRLGIVVMPPALVLALAALIAFG
ncbi:MAG TPA: arsenic transporter [Acetobacteraceae bacterium]|nr:arsenic transporter [Acetobacteraceae bacterium]